MLLLLAILLRSHVPAFFADCVAAPPFLPVTNAASAATMAADSAGYLVAAFRAACATDSACAPSTGGFGLALWFRAIDRCLILLCSSYWWILVGTSISCY